jgi:enoyl-CoA hydratase/carnithine racemase|tara:strand:+ start:14728 stop:15564 length:837 start_codon:yes stop_codon:yes gene_type:complete
MAKRVVYSSQVSGKGETNMVYEFIRVERTDQIATVVLNRPETMNALNPGIMQEIEQVSRSFLDDEQTRVVVFRGEGRHFSAGADLKQPTVKQSMVMQRRSAALGARMIRAITEISQVTISSIHGAALGGGACIPTACDFRIGSDECFCGYPEVNLGINLQWHALPLCVRLIGPARAKRMIMLGAREEAQTLLEWGFLDAVVPRTELENATRALAEQYARQPPIAVQMIKQSINAVSGALDDAIMHMDSDQYMLTARTDDRDEGISAFFEKRDPEFKGN